MRIDVGRRRGRGPCIRNCSTSGGRVGLDLQAHGGAAAALADFLLDGLEQVFDFVVVDFVFAVAGDAEDGGVLDLHAGEQLRQVQADDGFQRREDVAACSAGSGTKRGSTAGTCTTANSFSACAGPLQQHGQVERLVEQVRKRMAGVDGQRRQHREDLAAKDFAQVLADPRRSGPSRPRRTMPSRSRAGSTSSCRQR